MIAVAEQPRVERALWTVPREWTGERCFILCGGASLRAQREAVKALKGRFIAVKQSVILRPDADVMFISGKDDADVCAPFFPQFTGQYLVARSAYNRIPPYAKCLQRTKAVDRLCTMPTHLAGLDGGTSAINLAWHFGAIEIVMLGYDMTGGRWFKGEIPHHLPRIPQSHFDRHIRAAATLVKDLIATGVRIWNTSPISAAGFIPFKPLEAFL